MRSVFVIYAFAGILLPPLLIAENAGTDEPADVSRTVAAPGIDLHRIIESVSLKTHKKFIIDPRVRANVELVGVDVHDVTLPLLRTILEVHGYSVYEQDGVLVVLPDSNERQVPSPIVSPDNVQASDAEVITAIVPVHNISATYLVPLLRPLMPQNAMLSAASDRNALIVVDRAGNVRRLMAIIDKLDRLPEVKSPKLKPAEAGEQ